MKLCGVCIDHIDDSGVRWSTRTIPVRDPDGERYDLNLCDRHFRAYKTLRMRELAATQKSDTFIAVAIEDGQAPQMVRAQELS